jgi:spore coat protein U-like protein
VIPQLLPTSASQVPESFMYAVLVRVGSLLNPLFVTSTQSAPTLNPMSFMQVSQLVAVINAIFVNTATPVHHLSDRAKGWSAEVKKVVAMVFKDAITVIGQIQSAVESDATDPSATVASMSSFCEGMALNALIGLLYVLGSQEELQPFPGSRISFKRTPQGLAEPAVVLSFSSAGVFGDNLEVCCIGELAAVSDASDDGLTEDVITTISANTVSLPVGKGLAAVVKEVLNDSSNFVNAVLRTISVPTSVRDLKTSRNEAANDILLKELSCPTILVNRLKPLCLSALQSYITSIVDPPINNLAITSPNPSPGRGMASTTDTSCSIVAAYSVLIDVWPVLLTELTRNALDLGRPVSAVPVGVHGTVSLLARATADYKASYFRSLAKDSTATGSAVASKDRRGARATAALVPRLITVLSQLPVTNNPGTSDAAAPSDVVALSKKFIESLSTNTVPSMYAVSEEVTHESEVAASTDSESSSSAAVATSAPSDQTVAAKTFTATDIYACPMLLQAHPLVCFCESLHWHSVYLLYHLLCDVLRCWPKSLSIFNAEARLSQKEIGVLVLLFKVSGMEESTATGAPMSTPLLQAIIAGPSSGGDDDSSNLALVGAGTDVVSTSQSVSAFGNSLIDMCNGLLKRILNSDEAQIRDYLTSASSFSLTINDNLGVNNEALAAFSKPSLLLALRLFDLVMGYNSPQSARSAGNSLFLQAQASSSILRSIVQALSYFHLLSAKFSKYLLALIGRSLWQTRLQYLNSSTNCKVPQHTKSLLRSIASRIILIARDACTEYSKIPSRGYFSDVYQSLLQTAIMSTDLFGLELFDADEDSAESSSDPQMAPVVVESSHPIAATGTDSYQKVYPAALANRAGVPTAPGLGSTSNMLYCSRRLGREAIPGSDGQCGPTNGPQCADCKGMTTALYPMVGWSIAFDERTSLCQGADYVTLYKDRSHSQHWGEAKYCTSDLPGAGHVPPLVIDAPYFEVYFHSKSLDARASATVVGENQRLVVGDTVKLSRDYATIEDAAAGPLSSADTGEIVEDDGSEKPFKVRCRDGRTWWYCAGALVKTEDSQPSSRLVAGERVVLSPNYAVMGDARAGPLRPGDIGIVVGSIIISNSNVGCLCRIFCAQMKDDNSSKPFQVKVETGSKAGKTWWYMDGAVARVQPTSRASGSAGPAPRRRLAVGERVILSANYRNIGDASAGPLKPGDMAQVVKDDGSSKPFQVRVESGSKAGSTWWYVDGAIERVGTASSTTSGPWRLSVGERVVLRPGFEQCGDAAEGPLAMGDIGLIVEDDSSEKPFRVKAATGSNVGKFWWYEINAVQREHESVTTTAIAPDDRVVLNNEYAATLTSGQAIGAGEIGEVIEVGTASGERRCRVRSENHHGGSQPTWFPERALSKYTSPSQLIVATASILAASTAAVAHSSSAAAPPPRLVVGEKVTLSPDYTTKGDAKGGPLKPGDIGVVVKDDGSSKPFHVKAETGAKIDSSWWYVEGALVRVTPLATGSSASAASTGRLVVGEKVVLSNNYERAEDASSGPLKPHDVGVILKDDRSSKPFQVKVESGAKVGSTWWYVPEALTRAPGSSTTASAPAAAAAAAPAVTGRIRVGEKVQLSARYQAFGDAVGGPLKPQDVGVVTKDDGSSKPFQVKAETGAKAGSTWWYVEGAIERTGNSIVDTVPVRTGRLTVGEKVILSDNYEAMGDSKGGPLKVGDIGTVIKDDSSSKPFQVKSDTGAKAGASWWYVEGALTRYVAAPTSASTPATVVSAASLPLPPPPPPVVAATNPARVGRITVGERVMLSPGYDAMGDAKGGPLTPGDVGVLVKDDGSMKPFQVRADTGPKAGTNWWYVEGAIVRAVDNSAARVEVPAAQSSSAAPTNPLAIQPAIPPAVPPAAPPAVGETCERGPNWVWGEQDGGVGQQGKITQAPVNGWLEVRWESTNAVNRYRWDAASGVFDIAVVEARPVGAAAEGEESAPAVIEISSTAPAVSSSTTAINLPWGYRITATPFDASYAPETKILESPHPYLDNQNIYQVIETQGATSYRITFDAQSCFENGCDYVRFYKDSTHTSVWGEDKYTGGRSGTAKNLPGVNDIPPLLIPASSFIFHFHSDGKKSLIVIAATRIYSLLSILLS